MKFDGEEGRSPMVNVTPLIDALFLLLIFFMVSSTFRDLPGIPLDLPEAKSGEATRSSGVEIQIDREGVVRLEGRIVGDRDLTERLAEALDAADSRDLVLRADRDVPYGEVVRVMDAARQSRVGKLVVATENLPPAGENR
ncbi:MAG: biopolymer transporter ExbD [Candidatus Eisenbacteria bacterium]|nr:biopolymer transporter ExbD [Candidatus Eisenbacteria bacterium]